MSIFDGERSQLGLKPVGGSSAPASSSNSKSIFADERAGIQPQPSFQQQEQKFGPAFQDPSHSPFMQQVNQNNIDNPAPPHDSSRDIPIIGSILKGLDYVANSPIVRTLDNAAGQSMGVPDNMMNPAKSTGSPLLDKVTQIIGGTAGYLTNPAQIEQNVGQTFFGNQTLQNVGNKVSNAIESKLPNNFATRALANAGEQATNNGLGMAAYAPFQTLNQGGDFKDIPKNMLEQGLMGAGLGAAGGLAGSALSQSFDSLFSRFKPSEAAPIEQTQPILGLPEPRSAQRLRDAQQSSILEPNTSPIYGQGDVQTLGLPEGNYTQPTRLKVNNPNETLSYVMGKIKPEVMQTIEAPARRDLLINYIQKNTQYPIEDIHNRPMAELQQYGQVIQQDLHAKMPQIAAQVAAKYGHDLPSLLEGQAPNLRAQIAKDAQSQVYGVPARSVGLQKPSFNIQHVSDAAMPETKVKLSDARGTKLSDIKNVTDTPKLSDMQKSADQVAVSVERSKSPPQPILNRTELKHADTVKTSENTALSLKQALEDNIKTGKTTTDVINRTKAAEYITQHGQEGAANKIIAKQGTLTPHEVTAAHILAKQYSSMGGEANLNKALDLVGKTATKGREMGQAIQALSQWNKLDAEGALLQGSRSVGRTLTPAEGKPIIAATDRIQQVAATKSLADQVTHIITNKTAGEALTASEKDVIKQFQDQVKQVNEGVKPFLPKEKAISKADETIKKISEVAPKERTRDQVVSFLDAKAEKARQRIAASRQMGFAAVNKGNPVIDYAIIGASHIAKGVVKLSDFTEQMVKDFGESVKPHINEVFNKANNIFRKENGLPTVQELDKAVNGAIKSGTFTEEQAHQFKAWANEIGHMSDEFKAEATQDLQKAMNEIGTSTLGQKLSTIQTSAQLLSLPTAIRNVVGNEAFNIIEKLNKITAVPIDWTISKMTGERSIAFMAGNQEKYWSNFVKGAKGGWKGVSPNGQFASLDIHPEAFKSDLNPFKYLQKATGAMLQSFDHAAYMRAYGRTLGEYSKITGKPIGELDQTIHGIADHAGQYATFQDDTFLSKLATGAKRLLNKPTDLLGDALVNKGILPEGANFKGFGMGDLILKYAKTPANIVMRGIDYSPIGILRGMGELLPLLTKKEFNQRAATLALSRGITGTLGLTGLGVALISAGVLTGPSSSDADIRSLDTQTGKGEYKVNWSALSRYITSGLDKNAAQWQKGDNIFDWGWLQPMAISIAMGVNAQQSVAKQKADGTQSYVGVAKDALVGSLKTIMQQPLLQGVQSLVSGVTNVAKFGSWTGIANIFKGAPASFVPAISGQARNFTDNTARNTYDPNGWKTALNMIINKIPGLDKQLPIAYNTLGQANEQVQGGQPNTLSQAAKTFLSPVKMTNYTVSPEAKMIIDLINSSGDTKAAPRSPNKYLMVDKKKVNLTPDQYSEIQQQTGEATQKALSHIAPMLANPKVTDEIKVKEVVGVLDKVGQQVRNNLNKEYPELRSHLKVK